MRDEACADKLADERSKIRCDRRHPVAQVRVQLRTVLTDRDHLVAQTPDMLHVRLADLRTHRDLCSSLERFFKLLGKNLGQITRRRVRAEAHSTNHLGVGNIVRDNFAHLREVPAIPLLHTHGINIELLVQVVK